MLISASVVTRCVSISAFAYLVGVPISIRSSAAVLKMYAITSGIKKYDNYEKENKAWQNGIFNKSYLNFQRLINSYVGYNEYFPINVLREYDDMKKVIKNLKTLTVHWRF